MPRRARSPRPQALALALTLTASCTDKTPEQAVVAQAVAQAEAPASTPEPPAATPGTPPPAPPATPEPAAPEPTPDPEPVAPPVPADPLPPLIVTGPPAPLAPPVAPRIPSLDEGPLPPGLLRPEPGADATALPRFVLARPAVDMASIAKASPDWTRVLTHPTPLQVERFLSGMVVMVGDVPYEPGPDGNLVARPELGHKTNRGLEWSSMVLGRWPGDAWRIAVESRDRSSSRLAFYHLRADRRWGASRLIEGRWVEENMLDGYQWSPGGGVLLVPARWTPEGPAGPITVLRIGSKQPTPKPLVLADGALVKGVVETHDGTIHLFAEAGRRSATLEILRHCDQEAEPGCERVGGVALVGRSSPGHATWYETGTMVARQGPDFSAQVRDFFEDEFDPDTYLVHHERGGWALEVVPGKQDVAHMLPVYDGSLWIVLTDRQYKIGDTLWHRSPTGNWLAVPLPEERDGGQIQIALRDPEHVWISVHLKEGSAIYSARAALQSASE